MRNIWRFILIATCVSMPASFQVVAEESKPDSGYLFQILHAESLADELTQSAAKSFIEIAREAGQEVELSDSDALFDLGRSEEGIFYGVIGADTLAKVIEHAVRQEALQPLLKERPFDKKMAFAHTGHGDLRVELELKDDVDGKDFFEFIVKTSQGQSAPLRKRLDASVHLERGEALVIGVPTPAPVAYSAPRRRQGWSGPFQVKSLGERGLMLITCVPTGASQSE